MKRFCSGEIPRKRFEYRDTVRWWDPSKLPAVRKEIEARLAEVQTVEKLCGEILGVLRELEGLTGDPNRFNRKLVRVDQLRSAVQQYDRAYRIINSATQMAELRRFSADRKLGADDARGQDKAKRQLKRDLEFVEAMKRGADDTADILNDTLVRFDQAMEKDAVR